MYQNTADLEHLWSMGKKASFSLPDQPFLQQGASAELPLAAPDCCLLSLCPGLALALHWEHARWPSSRRQGQLGIPANTEPVPEGLDGQHSFFSFAWWENSSITSSACSQSDHVCALWCLLLKRSRSWIRTLQNTHFLLVFHIWGSI